MVAPLSRGLFFQRIASRAPSVCRVPTCAKHLSTSKGLGTYLGERLGLVGGEDETVTRGGFRCRGLFSLGHGMEWNSVNCTRSEALRRLLDQALAAAAKRG